MFEADERADGRRQRARQRFLAELQEEFIVVQGPNGLELTGSGKEICARWRRAHGLEPYPPKYDARQQRALLQIRREYGCNIALAERFGSTPEAVRKYRYRLRLKIAAQRCDGQSNQPTNP